MFAITVALVVATVLAFSFASTRRIGLLTITVLAFLYPHLTIVLLFIGVAVVVFFHFRNKDKS